MYEVIKKEIERRIEYLDKYKDVTETAASARQELIYLQSFIESMEKEQPQETNIKGWVARDKNGKLYIYQDKPRKLSLGDGTQVSWGDGGDWYELKGNILLDLKWEDEPIEVELTIHRV